MLPPALQYQAVSYLFHVVEGPSGVIYGPDTYEAESREDESYLTKLALALRHRGVEVEIFLSYGNVPDVLTRLSVEKSIDALVMGGHGHREIGDIFFSSTIIPLRNILNVPASIVR